MKSCRAGLLVIATATLWTGAPTAHADTQYGGAGLHEGTRPANPSIAFVRRDDGRVIGRLVLGISCGNLANSSKVVRVSGSTADGVNFSASGRARWGRGSVRVSLTGTLTPDAAAGTAHVRITGCRAYRRPFALRAPSAPAGAPAVPAPGALLFGFTSQSAGGAGLPVAVRVAKNGRVSLSTQSLVRCTRGRLPVLDLTPPRAIRPDGTFGGTQTYTIRYRGGFSERYRVTVHGQFRADGATGTLRVTLRMRDGSRRFVPCRSGNQTWTARR